jgi:eukaryotic-like serine/threonine-protein kinase
VIGQTLAGRYLILKKLGKGGFGVTYLAEDTQLPDKKLCVVKHLKLETDDAVTLKAAKKLFQREAGILNKLGEEHPQIPRLLAHFEENEEFYLVQEFIDGHDLSQEIKQEKQLQEAEVVNILYEVLDILTFVHQQQVIHRDIKPSNIMRRKKNGKLVLIDFGAVKEVATQISNSQGVACLTVAVGTPGYQPSKQSKGKPKFVSDIYALGMTGIFALTGIDPSLIPEDKETGEIIWRDRISVNPKLADILDKMVRYDFRDRYSSVVEVKEALKQIKAPPTDILPPHQPKFALVKKAVIATALLFTLGGSGYGGYYFWEQNIKVLPLTYENADYGIEMEYPDNWELEKIEDPFGTIARFYPQKEQQEDVSTEVTIEVEKIGSNTSLDEYTRGAIGKITKYLPEAKIIDSQEIKLENQPAHQIIYTGKNRDRNVTKKYLQVWILEKDRAYIMTYVAPEDKYQDFIETVEEMIIPSLTLGKDLL